MARPMHHDVLAIWLGTATVWLRRGSNVARILTPVALAAPVLLGLVACLFAGLLGVLMLPLLSGLSEEPPPDEPVAEWDGSALYEQLERLDSSGWSIVLDVAGMTTSFAAFLLGISTAVLLLTGASNRYFRNPRPMPGGAHPPLHPVLGYHYPTPSPHQPIPGVPQPFWYASPPGSGQAATPAPGRSPPRPPG